MKGKFKYRMTNKEARYATIGGLVFLLLLFVDQFTKAWAAAAEVHESEYFLGIIKLNFTTNAGMAFSWFSSNDTAMVIITVLTVFMILGIAFLFFTVFKQNPPVQICLAIIESGAVGNLIDRLYFNCVRDFLDITPLHFGVCNPADFCITLGAVALVFMILFIGPSALFPLTEKWRKEAKMLEAERERKKKEKKQRKNSRHD